MKTVARLGAGVRANKVMAATLLLMLLGITSCDKNPASPTGCKDACRQAQTLCTSTLGPGGALQAGWNAYCASKYDECVATCR